jgi:hypothetical protein
MQVFRDDDLYRHLRFSRTGSNANFDWFDILTWPGKLIITGDRGTYVFSRMADMFTFFRSRSEPKDGSISINPRYWAEKCIAADRDGIQQFSPEYFTARINEWLDEAEVSDSIREAVKEEVLSCADEGEQRAMIAAHDFEHDGFSFRNWWEVDCKVFTFQFLWICYAIAWGIQQYDAAKKA